MNNRVQEVLKDDSEVSSDTKLAFLRENLQKQQVERYAAGFNIKLNEKRATKTELKMLQDKFDEHDDACDMFRLEIDEVESAIEKKKHLKRLERIERRKNLQVVNEEYKASKTNEEEDDEEEEGDEEGI